MCTAHMIGFQYVLTLKWYGGSSISVILTAELFLISLAEVNYNRVVATCSTAMFSRDSIKRLQSTVMPVLTLACGLLALCVRSSLSHTLMLLSASWHGIAADAKLWSSLPMYTTIA